MKSSITAFLLLVFPTVMFSQVITEVLCDNFDTLTPGNTLTSESNIWETWSGGIGTSEDPMLSSTQYVSLPNSVYVMSNGATNGPVDFVLPFPSVYTSGKYEFSMMMYVTQGNGAYFNCGGGWKSGGVDYDYGSEIYFNTDTTGSVVRGGITEFMFTYQKDVWMEVKAQIDLGGSQFELIIDGDTLGSHFYNAAFGVVDIFAAAYTDTSRQVNGVAEFYIDNVCLKELSPEPTGISEIEDLNFFVYPTVNDGTFSVQIMHPAATGTTVYLSDVSGKLLVEKRMNSGLSNFVLSNLDPGVYFITLFNGKQRTSQKILIY
ncbi:MAG: T9SS type A sorting domain-containing protein [Chitinophagales bacterium]|nr:T9SS type A sorting domain-containing protein [Chitinophagales bacterium]